MSWVRLWNDMPTDPKWRVIAKKSNRPIAEVMAVFNFMLTNAATNATERGVLHNWSDEDVAAALDTESEHVLSIRNAMQGKTLEGDKITGWKKRQPKREDNSSERSKQWRERNRTQPNAEKRPDTESDTDTDKKENTKEKKPALSKKQEITLENLSVDHIAEWLARKRAEGRYIHHDEHFVLDQFKQYCKAKGRKYADYRSAYESAFEWDKCQPKDGGNKQNRARAATIEGLRDIGIEFPS